ncbi:uncharacterized protein BO87DRAFT_377900 [Aspergillus neoniger CBS 115656]|uniref:Uncharacterized protein n=1 Tax=Aspergillus neoniger (strain CBS 115656) TaxID=1448310 RepID=A0A318YFC9_ASPNB|nr:hypothetical protein BO87DRAFT_377900 [Aspergillus neoniger CBS 115656]PYH32839.1 hypothetical protein BO87DRAFT_377900 [Aspergillus neoniger CBS 115656]
MVHAAKVTVSFLICLTSPLFAEYAVLLPRAGLPNYLVRVGSPNRRCQWLGL